MSQHVIIGAGQVGTAILRELQTRGEDVVVFRASPAPVPGARTITGDVLHTSRLAEEISKAASVYHCIHTAYDHRAWRRDLPARESAVMDAAAAAGVPVVFPESVYAFGESAESLEEGVAVNPCSPLGEVRAELLSARASHPATTASVVASDVLGPTASAGSVATATIIRPVAAGRRAWIPADLDVPHSWTYLPDLARAMITVAENYESAQSQAEGHTPGDLVVNAPAGAPRTCRELAGEIAAELGTAPRTASIPASALAAVGVFSAQFRELHAQRYLWRRPAILVPGMLSTSGWVEPTSWSTVVRHSATAASGRGSTMA